MLHFQLVGAVVGFVSLFFQWETPHGLDWLYLFLVGTFSQIGQMFLTNALQRERVAGIAIVNSVGNVAGFVAPYMVGWIKDTTGSASPALLVIAASMTLASLLVFLVPKQFVNK